MTSSWIKCARSNNDHPSDLTTTSHHEFVKVPWNLTEQTRDHNSLIKYNTMTNTWTNTIQFPQNYCSSFHTTSYYRKKRLLYVLGKGQTLVIFDFNTLQATTYDTGHPYTLYYPVSMIINGEYHVVVGEGCNKHYKWDMKTKQFRCLYTFSEFNSRGMMRSALIYVHSRNIALLIGGKACEPYKKLNTIYCYSVKDETWKLLPIKLPHKMCNIGHVLTSDERFILLFGGTVDKPRAKLKYRNLQEKIDEIYILNLSDWSIVKSKVVCPEKNRFDCIIMNEQKCDELLVYGYLRYIWSTDQFIEYPWLATDLIRLLISWMSTEYVHLICNGAHWKIDVKEIFK